MKVTTLVILECTLGVYNIITKHKDEQMSIFGWQNSNHELRNLTTALLLMMLRSSGWILRFLWAQQGFELLWNCRWWTGEWQKCSTSCGGSGLTKRTVVCIRSLGMDKHEALLPSECQHLPRPEPISHCNTHISCPADWPTGNWSEVRFHLV